jgi:hypothetical protein
MVRRRDRASVPRRPGLVPGTLATFLGVAQIPGMVIDVMPAMPLLSASCTEDAADQPDQFRDDIGQPCASRFSPCSVVRIDLFFL